MTARGTMGPPDHEDHRDRGGHVSRSCRATSRLACLIVVFVLAGCRSNGPPALGGRRIELIHRAVREQHAKPLQAILSLEEAGPGAALERFRLQLWGRLLRSIPAPAPLWRRYIAAGLPLDLDRRARTTLGVQLLKEGHTREAIALLENAAASGALAADGALLHAPGPVRDRAARRMAVRDPARLHRLDARLERAVLLDLTPSEWIGRAIAWRRSGRPLAGARELSHLRWHGGIERLRRDECATCWLQAGQPRRALRTLAVQVRPTADELLLGARCELKRAWDLYPRRSSRALFSAAGHDAVRVATSPGMDQRHKVRALVIVLETMTEEGRLDAAWNAWVELRRLGWRSPRREWLGRRMGVRMARHSRWAAQVRELERELPGQRRCLLFWTAIHQKNGSATLRHLAAAPITDL